MLRCLAGVHPKLWDDVLSYAEFAYNSMVNRSTGKNPFQIVYMKLSNHIVDLTVIPTKVIQDFDGMLKEVKQQLIKSASHYNHDADQHQRFK